jgi:predicted phosphodiesterase
MRYLILSDIHANLQALEAVLDAAASTQWDRVVVLGDLVGYGADPNGVVDRVRALDPLAVIRGNHDKAACGLDDGSGFNNVARFAAAWTHDELTDGNRDYLRELPQGPRTIDALLEICHGAPFDEDYYIFNADDATRALDTANRPLCLFGHTHVPVVFQRHDERLGGFAPQGNSELKLQEGAAYLVNPGSVGQPRDGDPRAAYAVLDVDALMLALRRVEYPVHAAQRRILDAGLPTSLANRLAIGR